MPGPEGALAYEIVRLVRYSTIESSSLLLSGLFLGSVPRRLCDTDLIIQFCHSLKRDTLACATELKPCVAKIDLLIFGVNDQYKNQKNVMSHLRLGAHN